MVCYLISSGLNSIYDYNKPLFQPAMALKRWICDDKTLKSHG